MDSTLSLLRSLADLSERMRDAAQRLEWDELSAHAGAYFPLFDRLRTIDAPPASAQEALERASLMQQIAANQEYIRGEVTPWMESAGRLLDAWSRIPATLSTLE